MGQQVSVETFTSTTDTDGNKYWASFDPYPFKVGSRKLAYLGILNGDGPLKGQKCVVKTTRRGVINRKDWMLDKQRTQIVREISRGYNRAVSNKESKVAINGPIIAEIDSLSDCMCLNDLIGKPKKKFKEADYVSIELYLKGRFEDFEYGWVSKKELTVPEAFSHFSWCHSEGTLLVSNLQGVNNSNMYHFTGPVIHSEDKRFGSSDLGSDGIKGFFKLHECNRICRNWPRLGSGVDLRGWGELMFTTDGIPTAPPLPSPPPYEQHYDMSRNEHRVQNARLPELQAPHTFRQQLTPWQDNNQDHGMILDWREELMYQNMVLGQNMSNDSPTASNPMYSTQFMWIVKQMSYAFYNPPPPYCMPRWEMTQGRPQRRHAHDATSGANELDFYEDEDDKKCLLPPPYSEESVDPEFDCVTYL